MSHNEPLPPPQQDEIDFDWDSLDAPGEPCSNCGRPMLVDAVVCDWCERPSTNVGRRRSKATRYVLLTIGIWIVVAVVRTLLHALGV